MKILKLFRNRLSYSGLFLTLISTSIGLPMMFIDIFTSGTNPYAGIFTYLIFPAIATLGVVIAFLGAFLEHRRRKNNPQYIAPPLPTIDFNNKRHRNWMGAIILGVFILIGLMSVTSYQAYKFSDSTEFCGITCHEVMKPEYTAYQHSAHARVPCVDCHIGEGVDWFVKSKITGSYQVYSVMFDKFSRPIETPIKDLRPAQETCEKCHWPSKFYGAQQKTIHRYFSDEENTPWHLTMLLKIGGGDIKTGAAEGIHWHMNIKNKIEYVSTDENRLQIPWVRATSPEGEVTEYVSTEDPLDPADFEKYTVRRMDCIDCHNRPSHVYKPPYIAIDEAFRDGRMDPSLPYLKKEAVRLFSDSYVSEREALTAIEEGLPGFYKENHPELAKQKSASILEATQALKTIFSNNVFPEMKTDWRSHPNHTGHFNSDGCFRCHDGLHQSKTGKVISNDCNLCHTILSQGDPRSVQSLTLKSQAFEHPGGDMDFAEMKCTMCHGQDFN